MIETILLQELFSSKLALLHAFRHPCFMVDMLEKPSETLDATELYRTAVQMHWFEVCVAEAADRGIIPGLVHLTFGAEVLHAILSHLMDKGTDKILGSHRSHTLALAGGANPEAVAAEILGRTGGLSGGVAGTQHLMDQTSGFLTSTGIVASQVPLAAGAALSAKTLGTGGISIAVLGDGAVNQGAFQEAANLAAVMTLPLMMIVENNGIAQSTEAESVTAGTILGRARALGTASAQVSIDDLPNLVLQMTTLMDWVRSGGGPALLEVTLTRKTGHVHGADAGPERSGTDPLEKLAARVGQETAETISNQERTLMEQVFGRVESMPFAGEGPAL